ncbi:MAG TPA: carbamoyltransferase C-terminal domain-containing protein [Candidatus Acidoferrum sp.]|nr:carbamoyltransferase C-terminal domain-containing protein [Candidatus Acidoferrum sp.]
MLVLGISGMTHGPAAALLSDGRIVAAIEEGKLTRAREVEGIPRAAIQYCLEKPGIAWRDLDRIAIAGRPARACLREVLFRTRLVSHGPLSSAYFINKAFGELGRQLNNFRILRELSGAPSKIVLFDHHLCHAASAFYGSGFDRALILTLDERGDDRAGIIAVAGSSGEIREVSSIPLPDSFAWLFSQITRLLGFSPRQDEHKTQWLSLSGEPIYADFFVSMMRQEPHGEPSLNRKYFKSAFGTELCFAPDFYRALQIADFSDSHAAKPQLTFNQRANIAASLQKALSIVLAEWLEALRAKTQQRNLCLAGGLFLNPLLISSIERKTAFEQIFVQPAAGNEGTAFGAAWLAGQQPSRGSPRSEPLSNLYLGPEFSNQEIKSVLDNCKACYRWCESEDHKIEEALRLLVAGKTVAWFQGAAEFGPRALGDRSLLAYPWAPYVQENLNDYIKHRESFRPFALSIPAEDAPDYFDASPNAVFMTSMATPKQEALKALTGLSGFITGGLVRLHVVREADNPLFWKLLKKTAEKGPASAPLLVNTSFNLFGEPLVVTPRDAIRSYYCSGADALLIGSFLLTKR